MPLQIYYIDFQYIINVSRLENPLTGSRQAVQKSVLKAALCIENCLNLQEIN
jgi:hypothetical protein